MIYLGQYRHNISVSFLVHIPKNAWFFLLSFQELRNEGGSSWKSNNDANHTVVLKSLEGKQSLTQKKEVNLIETKNGGEINLIQEKDQFQISNILSSSLPLKLKFLTRRIEWAFSTSKINKSSKVF